VSQVIRQRRQAAAHKSSAPKKANGDGEDEDDAESLPLVSDEDMTSAVDDD